MISKPKAMAPSSPEAHSHDSARESYRPLPFLYHTLLTCALLSAGVLLGGCSIESEEHEEQKIEQVAPVKQESEMTEVDKFIAECDRCVLGDISNLQSLIETYSSTYTSSSEYKEGDFLYQQLEPTIAFERCAQKAMQEGERSAFDSMIVRPARVARISRYFYAQNNPTQGAFWLQRIVNMQGEEHGLEVAGRIFIQNPKTIGVGVRLLEQSARLGNRNARQMLLGLMNPGSTYYQEITRNSNSDNIEGSSNDGNDTEDDADSSALSSELRATRDAKEQAINAQKSAQNRKKAQQNISNLKERHLERLRTSTTAAPDTAAAAAAAAGTATSESASALEALENDSGEYNVPLEVYEQDQNSKSEEERTAPDAAPDPATTATAPATATRAAAAARVAVRGVNVDLQMQNRMQNQERLKALEAKASAAAEHARTRAASLHEPSSKSNASVTEHDDNEDTSGH